MIGRWPVLLSDYVKGLIPARTTLTQGVSLKREKSEGKSVGAPTGLLQFLERKQIFN